MKLRTLAVGMVGVVGAVYAASRLVPLAIDRAFADSSPREVAAAALSRVPRPSFRKSESADQVEDATQHGDDTEIRGGRHGYTESD